MEHVFRLCVPAFLSSTNNIILDVRLILDVTLKYNLTYG